MTTTYLGRFRDALTLMCGAEPPLKMCEDWESNTQVDGVDQLQDWVISQPAVPAWAMGIVTIEAAQIWALSPVESEGHLDKGEDPSPEQSERG